MEELQELWYALGCTSPRKELQVRDEARVYGLPSFVPLKYEVHTKRGVRQRMLVPAITGLMFVRGDLDRIREYIENSHYNIFIRKSTFSNKQDYLSVPLQAMDNFIAATENHEEHITYFKPGEITLREGDQVRIRGGLYQGREGVIMRIKGKRNRHLVVQIPGVVYAAIELTTDMLELKGTYKEKPSKNLDEDKRLLFDLAHRLLFDFSDKYQNENEYYLLRSELRRTQARLITFHGYTPSTECELALPLYMATVHLGEDDVEKAQQRLEQAIAKLKPTSLLRVKAQMYLAILSHNDELLHQVQSLFAEWRKGSLSANQRSLVEEYSQMMPAK